MSLTQVESVSAPVDKTAAMMEALEKLRQIMINNYKNWGGNRNREVTLDDYDIEFEFGSKYIKVVHTARSQSRSVAGFVVADEKHKKFAYGDLLKQAGWKAPAMNFSRGNVFELDGKDIAWTGIQ